MNILITGSRGFVGTNLCQALKMIKEGKDQIHSSLNIDNLYEYEIDSDLDLLEEYCEKADFVFNLAGVNRSKDYNEYMQGNYGFASLLLNLLKKKHNTCSVMYSSSIQATLLGRYMHSDYGKSKLACENLFFEYAKETGAKVLVYRFPNLFGKWCRPNYNSVVATFCNNIANDIPIVLNDSSTELELLYIDDLVEEMINALENKEHRCDLNGLELIKCIDGHFCYCPVTYHVKVNRIAELLYSFKLQSSTLQFHEIPNNSFEKKLLSTYLSYLPANKLSFAVKMNIDSRGSFTELLKSQKCGQISVNIIKPGITKGEHWHNSKWELFIVVSGHGLIQERRIGSKDIYEFEVTGDKIEEVLIIPGYVHNIINLSKTQDLVTIMWANEIFDSNRPDVYSENVKYSR